MIFRETGLKGAFLIEPERIQDERGYFIRTWCRREFESRGLDPRLVQCNISYTRSRGTLRGMHYQEEPYGEAKLVRCIRGELYDVIIDLRPGSPTYREWLPVTLTERNGMMLYIPEGFAHGFLTLQDDTEVFYQMSEYYRPDRAKGVRWNDPAFGIRWPLEVKVISERDKSYHDYDPQKY
ncbi:MAG: dTDP-4-dehydrorhamnose 3,5-epimerase, partial [Nitrospirales bacterium]|nr:dTDP-4-dehydrorhamnose 3,5-epimerase [Nitrospirales bacterium]